MRFRFPEKKILPGKTLIFLDEIQECQEAITSLKFWAIDNRYDVIVSGSLLGIDYKRASSYPVGYVDYLRMYGIDFEEFLWGMGISEDMIVNLCGYLESKTVIPEAIHSQMMNYYRQYIAIGGMPEAVQKYVDTKDFREVDKIQRSLLLGYQYDIAHYATAEEKVKAEKCYLSLAKQLLDKENHKFQYKEVEHGGRAQKYFSSIEWLLRADMVHLSKLVTDVRFDLDDYARDDFFRAYTTDLSLLMAMKDFSLKQHIVENTLEGNSKGGIYEYAITDALYKKGYQLYFYKNEIIYRQRMQYPPFCDLVCVLITGEDEKIAKTEIQNIGEFLKDEGVKLGCINKIIGPSAAPVNRIKKRYRFRVLLKTPNIEKLLPILRSVYAAHEDGGTKNTLSIDINPTSMI